MLRFEAIAAGVRRLSIVCLAMTLLLVAGRSSAQVTALTPKASTPVQAAAAPVDPLGRESPRGTVIGFVRAAQEGNWQQARQYLQPVMHGRPMNATEEQELVDHLLAVLNARFPTLDAISKDADVRGDDGRLLNETTVTGSRTMESFPLTFVRVDDAHFGKIWLVSQKTLDEVPAAYESLKFPQLAQKLPSFLVKTRALGMPLWQWLAIVLLVPIALALGWLLALIVRSGWQKKKKKRGFPVPVDSRRRRFGPGALLTAVFIHYIFVFQIGTSLLYRQYYQWLIWFLFAFGAYWALTHFTAWIFRRISRQLTDRGLLAERSLASLGQRVLNVLIFLVIGLIYLNLLDVNVTAALAGLGIGGLAIGLGAQKTFENLLGGISILTDKAIVVGDPCKIGDQSGVVEDIGLRSTKLRTEFRTVVSIPNGTVATATLENFRFRDKILSKQLVRLRYDLSPDHIRYALEQIRETLARNGKVEESTSRVRLLKLGDNGLEVEIYAYILERDYGLYLVAQEEMLLQVMEVLERTGAPVALPTQTTTVAQDTWIDPEKAAAARRAVEKQRDPGVPGTQHPELMPDGEKPRGPSA